jgi:hypothetical protein
VRVIAEALERGRKQLASYLSSDEGRRQLERGYLRQSTLAMLLRDIADQMAHSDGWTLLNLAVQLVREHAPQDLVMLRENYGYKTLKSFMLATELFEFSEEATPKGGVRVLYRLVKNTELH